MVSQNDGEQVKPIGTVMLGELARLDLKPGETLVLKVKERLSEVQINSLRHALALALPGHQVLILDRGMDIGVLGKKAQ